MDRRSLIKAACTIGTLAAPTAAGCLQSLEAGRENGRGNGTGETNGDDCTIEDPGFDGSEWEHEVGGLVDVVAHGRVFGREDFAAENADGGVFCLDAETGAHEWTYGESGGYTTYTRPTVEDAVYVGRGTDAIGDGSGELYALEFDGEERWVADEVGSVYESPRVADCTVYVGGDDGVVRAFDANDGEELWNRELVDGAVEIAVEAVTDVVYVHAGLLFALSPEDGSVLWSSDETAPVRGVEVVDDVAFLTTGDHVAAVVDGEERWREEISTNKWIHGVDSGRVIVRHRWNLLAFDVEDGAERWRLEDVRHLRTGVHDGRVYVGGEDGVVRALDASDGEEIWTDTLADEPIDSLTVVEEDERHAVFFNTEDRLSRVDPDGEVTWSAAVDGGIRNHLIEGFAFVGTREGIHSIEVG